MGIDKFGHDLNYYYRKMHENEYHPKPSHYELRLKFESDKINPHDNKYFLHGSETSYKILLDSTKIMNIRSHPKDVVIVLNGQEYAPEQLIGFKLKRGDELSFVGTQQKQNQKLFVEVLLKCPISFDDSHVGYGILRR